MGLPSVLIVDDDKLMRLMTRDALKDVPCTITEAISGELALKAIAEQQPDVVLLDLVMPGPSGVEVLQRINQQWPNIAVWVLSSLDSEGLVRQALDSGARGYLVKPFHPLDLQNLVRAAFEGKGTPES